MFLVFKEAARSWWLLVLLITCAIVLENALSKERQEYAKLSAQWHHLQAEKERLLAEQADLRIQVNSQSDPAWVELTLMLKLGLVPEDQTKVFFR